jgi:hypothetical protein
MAKILLFNIREITNPWTGVLIATPTIFANEKYNMAVWVCWIRVVRWIDYYFSGEILCM